jgi:hypothetical protein
MQVLRAYTFEQFVQSWDIRDHRSYDDSPPFYGKLHRSIAIQADLERKRAGDPHSQTIAPFLDT